MDLKTFFANFQTIADSPGGMERLRELILELATSGRLSNQNPSEQGVNLPSISGPHSLPWNWTWVTLPTVTKDLGQKIPTSDFHYIDVGSINSRAGRISDSVSIVAASAAPSRARKKVAVGTIIYSTVRPYLRNIAIVNRDFQPEAIASTAFAVLHPGPHIDEKYLFICVRSPFFTRFVESKQKGVAYPAINASDLRSAPIPLPPLAEQKRIVDKAEALMVLCDELESAKTKQDKLRAAARKSAIESISTASTQLELEIAWRRISDNWVTFCESLKSITSLRSLILELAVQGRLASRTGDSALGEDGLPTHWTRGQLQDFAGYIQRGKGPKYVERSSVPVVSQKCVKWSGFDLDQARFVDPTSLPGYNEDRYLRGGDLLWNSTGTGTVGRTSLFVESEEFPKVVADSHVTVIRSEFLVPRFLWCWTASPMVQSRILGSTTGSTNQQELNLSTIKTLPIAFPRTDEQLAIMDRVDELMSICNELEVSIQQKEDYAGRTAKCISLLETYAA